MHHYGKYQKYQYYYIRRDTDQGTAGPVRHFFEDINHAADGGLYGEMVRNRAFEFDPIDNKTYCHMTAWEEVQRGNSFLQAHIEQWDPRNVRNPHYLVLEVLAPGEGAGIRNEGYNKGIPVEQGKEYRFTSWCRIRGGTKIPGRKKR